MGPTSTFTYVAQIGTYIGTDISYLQPYGEKIIPSIYSHQKPNNRVINFAYNRQLEIKNEREQLDLEYELMQMIIDQFKTLVCRGCYGAGTVMRVIEGCECDGPRLHTCDRCGGTGELK